MTKSSLMSVSYDLIIDFWYLLMIIHEVIVVILSMNCRHSRFFFFLRFHYEFNMQIIWSTSNSLTKKTSPILVESRLPTP
jgi:hypothetical protein